MTAFATDAPGRAAPLGPAATPARAFARRDALLLLLQFAAMWGAFFVLASAINRPASLDEPASVMLPMILDQAGPVFAGNASYLLHALLLIPLAVILHALSEHAT